MKSSSIAISSALHISLVVLTALSLPFLSKKPIDLPPIVSVELIQIAEETSIPFAPKAKKIIEKVKEKEKKLVSEQAPPKKVKKTKTKTVVSEKKNKTIEKQNPEAVPLPEKEVKKIKTKEEKKQNPEKVDNEVKQVSEFEKKDAIDPNEIQSLINKAKEENAEKIKKNNKVTQDQVKNIENSKLTFSEEDALRNQLFGCWNFPLGIPYDDNLIVRIKLKLERDGTVTDTEVLDHARMNKPGQNFYKILAESALRAIRMCTPLKVPSSGYERWKEIQMNFDAREMLRG